MNAPLGPGSDVPLADLLGMLHARPGAKWQRHGPEPIAAWVADMDFPPAPVIVARIEEEVAVGDFGYRDWFPPSGTPLRDVFAERSLRRHGWRPDPAHVRELDDVMQGVQAALHVGTEEGDGVLLHTPAYPPFLDSLSRAGRRVVEIPARSTPEGWAFDHDALRRTLDRDPLVRAMLLCNPHNPTGHVFRRDELEDLATLAAEHDLLVISDEIHADLVHAPLTHIPIASLGPAAEARTVTVTSPSKAFNLAAMRTAVAHVGHAGVRAALDALPNHLIGAPNLMGVVAAREAWTNGDEWLAEVMSVLDRNRRTAAERLGSLPGVTTHLPEATYLLWVDATGTSGGGADIADHLLAAGVAVSPGPTFGRRGDGCFRLNLATWPNVLDEVLTRVERVLTA